MANPEHLKILNQGVEAWNEWREENPEARPDLTKADLFKANLSGAELIETTLRAALLARSALDSADAAGRGSK